MIRAEDGKALLPGVRLERGAYDGGDKLPFVYQEAEGPGAAQNVDGDEESVAGTTPIAAARLLVFLDFDQGRRDDSHCQRWHGSREEGIDFDCWELIVERKDGMGIEAEAAIVPALHAGAGEERG